MYADDSVIMYASSNYNELLQHMQQDIDKVNKWLEHNKLLLNTNNSNYMIFEKKQTIYRY